MLNSIRKSQPVESSFIPSPMYTIKGVQIDGESVLDVSLPRELVDKRVKVPSAKPLNLMSNGVKPGKISVSAPMEDGLKAINMVRNIVASAESQAEKQKFRDEIEAALGYDPLNDPANKLNTPVLTESSEPSES